MLIPLLHVATSVATCNRGPILCKLDFGSVYTNKSTQLPPPRCAPAARSAAAVRAPATQQTQYLGESAETPETAANGLELPFPATTFRAATPPSKFHRLLQSPPRALSGVSHAAPSISPRPARSHRRSFGASSPCRKNEQENCMFTWEWRPRRPPASPPAAGESFPAPPSSSTSSHERPRAHDQPSPEHPSLNPPIL
jgi:hypothetical protein